MLFRHLSDFALLLGQVRFELGYPISASDAIVHNQYAVACFIDP